MTTLTIRYRAGLDTWAMLIYRKDQHYCIGKVQGDGTIRETVYRAPEGMIKAALADMDDYTDDDAVKLINWLLDGGHLD